MDAIRSRGGNALHVYAERLGSGGPGDAGSGPTPGYKLGELSGLVSLTRTLDMYLVITVGNTPGSFDHDFTVDFWDLYAAEFGDDPHVIFEVQNEPYAQFCPRHSAPSPLAVLEMERDAFCKIREHAPSSAVLLFSYAMFGFATGVLDDIAAVEQMVADPTGGCGRNINWSRTGIAFHGYDFPTVRSTIETVTDAGYGVVQTEFAPYCEGAHCGTPFGPCYGCDIAACDRGALQVEELELYEELGISWLSFMRVDRYLDDASFKDRVDAADLLWLADFGSWPATSDPPVGTTVSLFSEPGSRYVSADLTIDPTNPPLRANEIEPGLHERFDVIAHGPGAVALKARANDKYVRPASDLHLKASSSSPVGFEWFDRPDGRVTLRPTSGLFVSADYDLSVEAPLVADRIKGGGEWEAFVAEEQCPVPLHHLDYCALCGPCQAGESDCDSDLQCASGLVCAHDVGANYGLPPEQDVCELANNPPVARADSFATPFATSLVILNTDLMDNDVDPDPGDEIVWVTPQTLIASEGSLTQATLPGGAIRITYSPPQGFSGTATFTYRIEDDHGLEAVSPGRVTVQVMAPPNTPPVASPDSLSTPTNVPLTFTSEDLTGNDTDPDPGDTVVFPLQTLTPELGDIVRTSSVFPYTYVYTPPAGFAGEDTFVYTITDNHGLPAVDPGQVTIDVFQQAPTAVDDRLLVPYLASSLRVPQAYLLANDTDPNGDVLRVSDVGPAGHGSVRLLHREVFYEPNAGFWSAGSDAFTYDVTDGVLTAQGIVDLAAEPVCETYLGDDFETGDLSAWSRMVAAGGGSLTADAVAAAEGGFGLLVAPAAGTTFLYVEDRSPVDERHFRARFHFNTGSFVMPAGAEHSLLTGLVPGSNAFGVRLAGHGGAHRLRLAVSRDDGSQILSEAIAIADSSWHRLFVDWWASTAPGSDDGGARLWVDGMLIAEILGVDNDERGVERVRLGAPSGLDAGSSGTYYFDAYASCDGPRSRQILQIDDFETGTLAAWDAVVAIGGTVTASPAAALAGAEGLAIGLVEGAGQLHVRKGLHPAAAELSVELDFDPNSVAMADGSAHPILHAGTSSGGALAVTLMRELDLYQLRIQAITDSGQTVRSGRAVLSDQPHTLRLEFHKATAPGVADGSLRLWIDGTLVHTLTGLDNAGKAISDLRLGAIWQLDPGTVGSLYFDNFRAWQ